MSFKLVTILLPLFTSRMGTRAAPARFTESDALDLTKRATQTFNLQISYQSNDFLKYVFLSTSSLSLIRFLVGLSSINRIRPMV